MYNMYYHVWSLTFFPFKCHCYYCVADQFFCKIIKSYIFLAAAVVLLLNGSPNKQHLKSHPIKHTQDTSTDSVEHQQLDPSYGTSSNKWTPGALYEGHYVYLYEHWHQAAHEWDSDGGAAEANQQMHWGETSVRHGTHVEVYRYRTEFSTLSIQNWIKRCRERLVLELWGSKKEKLTCVFKRALARQRELREHILFFWRQSVLTDWLCCRHKSSPVRSPQHKHICHYISPHSFALCVTVPFDTWAMRGHAVAADISGKRALCYDWPQVCISFIK